MRLNITMRRRIALGAVGVLVAGGIVAISSAAYAAPGCRVTYTKAWEGGGGFGGNITITNVGDPFTSWTLTFTFPSSTQKVTQGWSANWSQSGQNVTATSMSWNGSLATNASTSIGFNGTGSGNNPTTFSVNGTSCTGTPVTSAVPTTSRPPTSSVVTTRPPTTRPPTSAVVTSRPPTSTPPTSGPVVTGSSNSPYTAEFLAQYNKIKDPANGYFSPEGVPYHSIETLMVEAPDHGHETTSEAYSFWLWLEAQYGRATGNWTPFNNAWTNMETYIIPTSAGQPGGSSTYKPSDPADFAPEKAQPSGYPVALDTGVTAGSDPLASELNSTYGNNLVYGMHWLLDVDDIYGYGTGRGSGLTECGDNTKRVTYINTYQRGPQESVWETVPHPSCETLRYGQSGYGYPPLFISGSSQTAQWRYTDAPDADARAVQAAYWALTWATAQGKQSSISSTVAKAAKMGDYLRYAMYDKYFKNPGCTSPSCTPGSGKSSSSYMLTWYYAWGGDNAASWSWRIGSSSWHQGYQNPLAAWVLSPSGPSALRPLSSTAATDWNTSLTRQLDSYLWLQSAEGAIAGGATNSWNGAYEAPPSGTPTFYGWAYDWQPVFHDPPSNRWFGFQAWSLERVAEYYWVTGDAKAKQILDKWVPWAIGQTTCSGTSYAFPSDMNWTGQPSASYSGGGSGPAANPNLHVTVANTTQDVGVGAAYVRTLAWYAAKANNASAKSMAKCLLDGILSHKDTKGVSVAETRDDYNRFDDVWSSSSQTGLYIPSGFTGTMPNGDTINSSSTFLSIRSFYKNDPDWAKVQAYLNGGSAPTFNYHRFWAQSDIAMAAADYGALFPAG